MASLSLALRLRIMPASLTATRVALSRSQSNFWDVLSKEAAEERRQELKEDIRRGAFHDLKDLKETGGRLGEAAGVLTEVGSSDVFPEIRNAVDMEGREVEMTSEGLRIISMAFKAGAQEQLNSWTHAVASKFAGHAGVTMYEVGLIDSLIMGVWPFRNSILRNAKQEWEQRRAKGQGLQPIIPLFCFGDAKPLQRQLKLHNKLAGFVFLVDGKNRIRWRVSGQAEPGEPQRLVKCVQQLLHEMSMV